MSKSSLHQLVRRQLRKHGLEDDPRVREFASDVSRAYEASSHDLSMLERSLDLSSNELLEANRDLRAIIAASPDLYFWLREDGTIRSARAERNTDLLRHRSELVGCRIQDVPVPRVAARFAQALEAVRQLDNATFEYSLNIGGEVHDYEARLLPLPGGGALAIIRNIDSQRMEQVELFRQMSEGASDILYLIDARTGKVLFVNSAFEQIWGLPREMVYSDITKLTSGVHPDDRARMARAFADPRTDFENEYRILRPDGTVRWVVDRGHALCDDTGEVYRVSGVSRDITALKEREASIEAEKQSLAEQVREGQMRLRQLQKMEALGRLAGGVSHDFNNLLVVILSYAELLREAATDTRLREDAEKILNAAARGTELTKQLLAFSRRQLLEPRLLSLNDVLLRSKPLVERLVSENITLSYELDHRLPPIFVDGGQVEQIVMNLVVNARDAVADGGRIIVRSRTADAVDSDALERSELSVDSAVVLEVIDDGTGIAEEIRDSIFEPFFTTKPEGKGTGLGLATVFGIVEQSGGHVDFATVPGATAFRVYFSADHSELSERVERDDEVIRHHEAHIMVVEDDEVVRGVAVRILEQAGYTVSPATNGRHALEVLAGIDDAIDMVITDIVMPEMGGRELAEHLRSEKRDIKVLFMSGYTEDAMVREGVASGAESLLHKPFTPSALRRRVGRILSAL